MNNLENGDATKTSDEAFNDIDFLLANEEELNREIKHYYEQIHLGQKEW